MPEIMRRVRVGQTLIFSINERVISKLGNRFGLIRDNHLCYALGTNRRISDMEAIIIQRKISIVLPQILPLSRVEMSEAQQI